MKAREKLLLVDGVSSLDLFTSAIERRMKARAVLVVEIVLFVG
jgi:hypothetical protein